MGNKIVITRKDDYIITCLFEGEELLRIQADKGDGIRLLGNIYLGKVKNIVKNINAAFVEIEDKQICYLPLNKKESIISGDGTRHSIKAGDELIVQVVKEDIKTKAPVVTTNFNLTGKYLVLVHGKQILGISSKIGDKTRREELKKLLKPYITGDYGFIVRTNAENAPMKLIERELNRLKKDYMDLVQFGIHRNCFSRLYTTPPSYIWEIRDGYSDRIDEIKTDDANIYGKIKEYMAGVQDEDLSKLVFYEEKESSLNVLYGIGSRLEKALQERVWMESGAYIVIQPTEAMTVIDVNTGKATVGKQKPEETFYSVNCEAAEEIARQIRIRNLSGIIIIDFIDMKDETHKKLLMKRLDKLLKEDRIPAQLIDITPLNLVEITRKKVRRPLYEQFL